MADEPAGPSNRSTRQTAVIAAGRLLAAGLSALWFVVAARLLTLDEFSDLALILAIGSALFFLADAGYSTLLSAHTATVGAVQGRAVRGAVVRRINGSILALAVLVPAYLVAATDQRAILPVLFVGSLVGNAVHGSVTAALRSVGQSGVEAANEVVSRVLMLAVGWWWLANGGGVAAAVIVYSAADLASAVALTAYLMRWLRRHPAPPEPLPDLHWRRAAPIAVGAGFSTIYGRLDTWLVALLAPTGAAGIYAACYRITEAIRIPAQASGAVTLADATRAGPDGPKLAAHRSRRYLALAVIPTAVLLIGAEPILRLTFGPAFADGAWTLRVLALAAMSSAAVSVLGPYVAVRSGRIYPMVICSVAVLNGVLNVVLIPRLGGVGASWANLASETALAALMFGVLESGRMRRLTADDSGPLRPS